VDKFWDLKRKHDSFPEGHQERVALSLKLAKVKESMQEEWFLKIRQEGDTEITPEMGKPSFKSEKKFLEDIEVRHKKSQEFEKLRKTEAYKENLYRQIEQQQYDIREAGENDVPAPKVVPSLGPEGTPDVDFHAKPQEGAVSGTSSEDDVEYGPGFTVKDLSQVRWSPKLEAELEDMLVRN
jgi:hypothetical protein